ncbi:MAG: uroporphyrinogen decarboxylase family protein [Pseudomonadota bacterium]
MGSLRDRAKGGRPVFAPIVFGLAMRLEQVDWQELSQSPSEAVFVLRSVERLFKLDAVCANFDPWLEAEAAGVPVERDELGQVSEQPRRVESLPSVQDVVQAGPVQNTLEIIRRLVPTDNASAPPLASITVGASLVDRLSADADSASRLSAGRSGGVSLKADADLLEYASELASNLARAYLDAGAAGLMLLQDLENPDLIDIDAFEGLFNLGAYYDVPVVFVSRTRVGETGLQALKAVGNDLYITPGETGASICALDDDAGGTTTSNAWLASTRWETDPTTSPETIHNWRRQVVGA